MTDTAEKQDTLTKEQVYDLLPTIHTFMNPGGMLLGADWGLAAIVELIENAKRISIGGEMCRGMGHGIAVEQQDGRFIWLECDKEVLADFMKERGIPEED